MKNCANNIAWMWMLFVGVNSVADDTLDDPSEEVRSYTVEMIIFSYTQDVGTGSEIFVPDKPAIDGMLQDDRLVDQTPTETSRPMNNRRPFELIRLAREDFSMREQYSMLQRLGAYRPLMHFGWTQPTLPEDESEARPLSSFARTLAGLDGELTLYLSRYLHLNVDLTLDAPSAQSLPVQYRIAENRIFSNGDLRYFDHPKFGVLAKITRVVDESSDDEPAVDESYEEEFLGEPEPETSD